MLFKHHRRFYNVLQVGMDVASLYVMYYLEHQRSRWIKNREFKLKYLKKLFDANNILCLPEVHGKDEYLKAFQVLAPRCRFFGTFIPDNENAGGSAICIHKDLLLEEAIVTHLVTSGNFSAFSGCLA